MAVLECKITRTGRRSAFRLFNQNEHEVQFAIVTDSKFVWESQIIVDAKTAGPDALPEIGATYAFGGTIDLGTICTDIQLEQDRDDPSRWTALAKYSVPPEASQGGQIEDPLLRPVLYNLEFGSETKAIEKDKDGNPIVNSVGDEFDEALQDEIPYNILVARKNFLNIQQIIDLADKYDRTVNSDTFYGQAPRTWRFLPLQSTELITEGQYTYYQVAIRLALKKATWDAEVLDRGWRYRKVAGGPLQTEDEDSDPPGMQLTKPVRLLTDGTKAAIGQEHYIKFQYLTPINYGPIGGQNPDPGIGV